MAWFLDSLAWYSQPCGITPTYLSICILCRASNWAPLLSKYLICCCPTTSVRVVASTVVFLSHYCILSFSLSFEAELKCHRVKLLSDLSPAAFPARCSSFAFPWHTTGMFIQTLPLAPVSVSRMHCLSVYGLPSGWECAISPVASRQYLADAESSVSSCWENSSQGPNG